jgi:adenine-specific DNA-methyltransferase
MMIKSINAAVLSGDCPDFERCGTDSGACEDVARLLCIREELRRNLRKPKDEVEHLRIACGITATILRAYQPDGPEAPVEAIRSDLAVEAGVIARNLDVETASYYLGSIYTVLLPPGYRSRHGVFYTPPAVTARLLDMVEEDGVDWATVRACDPACGGGAFLAPMAARMLRALNGRLPGEIMAHIAGRLRGFELDPFSGWMSQMFLAAVLSPLGQALPQFVVIGDSLSIPDKEYGAWDLVIGNPPYGKVKLEPYDREKWARSLFGHANLYGLFTDLAVHLAAEGGIIAYVTPTSFLGGQYFQALRKLLVMECSPVRIDFLQSRQGIFADVLQETALTVYRRVRGRQGGVVVDIVTVTETSSAEIEYLGRFDVPSEDGSPWLLPRQPTQVDLLGQIAAMPTRLSDLGYEVSTGPLVWNRHKTKLASVGTKGMVPVVWAECIPGDGSGAFRWKVTGDHLGWFRPRGIDDPNLIDQPCVLLQRTTAVEQRRRLIAAVMPVDFLALHPHVAVENHVNMIRPIRGQTPKVGLEVVAALLNSQAVDLVFRCINGSVAVSAYEIEAMPMPTATQLQKLKTLIARHVKREAVEIAVRDMYAVLRTRAAV